MNGNRDVGSGHGREAAKPLVLIVDDVAENLRVLGNILQNNDACAIAVATSGQEALDSVAAEPPDLILLDVMMPGLDGYEVLDRLKAAPGTSDIPVIFLTAKVEPEDIVKGLARGAVDYVTKPFNSAELLARVQTHLELRRSRQAVARISRERKELLHMLCHDLANPLGAIAGFLEIADTPEYLFKVKRHISQAAGAGLAIIALIRKMQALEEGKIIIQAVSLPDAVRESAAMLGNMIARKEIKLELQLEPGAMVRAEATSLVNSVLNNLLTNAVKFSPRGGRIRVALQAGAGRAQLAVRDEGIGMPPALLRDLFDLRKTTSRPGTEGESGTGFGMPLVRRFMRSYGGDIVVTSSETGPDRGTEAVLAFQIAPGGAPGA